MSIKETNAKPTDLLYVARADRDEVFDSSGETDPAILVLSRQAGVVLKILRMRPRLLKAADKQLFGVKGRQGRALNTVG